MPLSKTPDLLNIGTPCPRQTSMMLAVWGMVLFTKEKKQ